MINSYNYDVKWKIEVINWIIKSLESYKSIEELEKNFPKIRNKLTNYGRVVLSPYFLELKHKNFSVFTSRDCLNLPIVGGLYSKDIFKKGRFSIDFVVGGYLINKKEWSEVSRTYWLNGGIVPLVGGVSTLEVFKNKDFSVNFKTSVFPLIIQNGVFLKKEF